MSYLEEIQHQVDAREVLEHYGAKNIIEQGDELIHSCVLDQVDPHHTHGDASPSASLNKKKLLFNCFSYGGGDLLWLLEKLEETDRAGVHRVLGKFLSGESRTTQQLLERINKYFVQEEEVEHLPRYNPKVIDSWRVIHPYMTEDRGIDPEVLKRFDVGYDERENRIVFPHYWAKQLVGWQKRLTGPRWPKLPNEPTFPKYKNSPSFPRLETLYNLRLSDRDTVVVVESVLSVLKAETHAQMHPLFRRTTATFGSKVSDQHVRLLKRFPEVIIFFDDDIAGWIGAHKLLRGLENFTRVRVVTTSEGDLADLPPARSLELLRTAEVGVFAKAELERKIREERERNARPRVRIKGYGGEQLFVNRPR